MADVMALLLALAAYYPVHVVTRSAFPPSVWLRGQVFRRFGVESPAAYLVTCGWCLGGWVSFALVGAVDLVGSVPLPAVVWFAAAAGCGTLSEVVDLLVAAYNSVDREVPDAEG